MRNEIMTKETGSKVTGNVPADEYKSSSKIKEENVDILNWEYIKEKDEYVIIFKISNLEPQRRERIIKRQKSGFLKSQGANIEKIVEVNGSLYIKESYESDYIEMYESLIPLVQNGVIPERLDPEKVEIEEDLCMIEQDMKHRMDFAGRSVDELRKMLQRIK